MGNQNPRIPPRLQSSDGPSLVQATLKLSSTNYICHGLGFWVWGICTYISSGFPDKEYCQGPILLRANWGLGIIYWLVYETKGFVGILFSFGVNRAVIFVALGVIYYMLEGFRKVGLGSRNQSLRAFRAWGLGFSFWVRV